MSTLDNELIKEVTSLRELNNRLRTDNSELRDANNVITNALSRELNKKRKSTTLDVTRYTGTHKKTVEISVSLKDLVPGRTYMCELIKLDDGEEVVALRSTDYSVYEKVAGFKKHVCTCGL